jgi:transposase
MNDKDSSAKGVALYVGWDWSDQKHDLYLRLPGHATGTHQILKNTPEDLRRWFERIDHDYPHHKVVIALEGCRSALLPLLLEFGHRLEVFWLNPRSLSTYRQTFRISGAKSDALDCQLAADLAISHPEHLHHWNPEDESTLQLALEVEQRRHLVDLRTLLANRLKAHLKCYFPQALELFKDDLTSPIVSAFLKKWPNFQSLKKARRSTLQSFRRARGGRWTRRVDQFFDQISQRAEITTSPKWLTPHSAYTQALAAELMALHPSIRAYDQRIAQLTQEHSAYCVVSQLPGAGPVLKSRILAIVGEGANRYTGAEELAVISGIAPVIRSSGKSKVVLRRHAFPHFMHQTFIEFAKSSAQWCDWAAAFLKTKQEKGWEFYRAIRALAYKWIRIISALSRNQEPYDESKYMNALKKHNSPYAQPSTPQTS